MGGEMPHFTQQLTFTTFVEVARYRAQQRPDDPAVTFLEDGETQAATLTYGQLDARARALATVLQSHAAIGDRVVLSFPPGLENVIALLGCMYAGLVPVPSLPLYPSRPAEALQRLVIH
jgi:acyl-CoA synthetase (AMP-forming)/AMP-acid ligase II